MCRGQFGGPCQPLRCFKKSGAAQYQLYCVAALCDWNQILDKEHTLLSIALAHTPGRCLKHED